MKALVKSLITHFCNERIRSRNFSFIFWISYNSSTTLLWGKDRLDNGRGIRNWKEIYIFYISVDPRNTFVYLTGREGKGLWGKKEERVHEKCRKCDWNGQIFWTFPWIFPTLYRMFRTSFSDKNDIFRLKSMIFCILHVCFWTCLVVEYFKYSSIESKKVTCYIRNIILWNIILYFTIKFYC